MTDPNAGENSPTPETSGAAGDGNLAVPMKLRAFLEGIAAIYDLPEQRRKGVPAPDPRKKAKRARIPAARQNALLVAVAVTSALWAFAALKQPAAEFGILPLAMNGGWHTSDARYRNRAFWIKGDRIAFQIGSDSMEVSIHKITQVDQKIIGGDTLQYTLQYLVDGAPTTWQIQFLERPKPEIRFLNQMGLAWTRTPNSPWPAQ